MTISRRRGVVIVAVSLLLCPLSPAVVAPFAVVAVAVPPGLVQQQLCTRPEYRKTHLAECNQQESPFLVGGGGGGGNGGGVDGDDGGLIGGITRTLHRLGIL